MSRHGAQSRLHLNKNMGILTFYRPVETGSPQGASECYTDDLTQCTTLNKNKGILTFYRPVKTGSPQGASRRSDTVYYT